MARKKKLPKKEIIKRMKSQIAGSFTSPHKVFVGDQDMIIQRGSDEFLVRLYTQNVRETSSTRITDELSDWIKHENDKGKHIGFAFFRSWTDYEKGKNTRSAGPFLKQSFGHDPKLAYRRRDNHIKVLTPLEIAVEGLFDKGMDSSGYRSRIVYFDAKSEELQAWRFRETFIEGDKSLTKDNSGYLCDIGCRINAYHSSDQIDFNKCREEIKCTMYARGRNLRYIKKAGTLKQKIRIRELEEGQTDLKLVEIAGR